jgi:hypothetical protein
MAIPYGRRIRYSGVMGEMLKKPSVWIPIVLSLGIIAMLLITLSTVGLVRQADEGTEAHIFQLWLVLEAFLIAFFGFKWLPSAPKDALFILAIQIVLVLLGMFPVFYFHL